jgi:hypothetical protein
MKKTLFLIALIVVPTIIFAQNDDSKKEMETLWGNKELSFGGFGGPRVSFSKFDGQNIWLVGGMGAVLVNHSFFFGGGGYGIVNEPNFANVTTTAGNGGYLGGGYGGVILGFIVRPHKVAHLSFPVLIGAGNLFYSDMRMTDHYNTNPSQHIIDQSNFFVVEPSVEVELNVFRFMRFAAGVSYRYAPNVSLIDTPSNAFNGPSGSITFKFGTF